MKNSIGKFPFDLTQFHSGTFAFVNIYEGGQNNFSVSFSLKQYHFHMQQINQINRSI